MNDQKFAAIDNIILKIRIYFLRCIRHLVWQVFNSWV